MLGSGKVLAPLKYPHPLLKNFADPHTDQLLLLLVMLLLRRLLAGLLV
jgi:hypothetical protein